MGVRQRLNEAALRGALVMGGIIGSITGSWTVFTLIFVIVSWIGGEIRGPRHRHRTRLIIPPRGKALQSWPLDSGMQFRCST